MRYILLKNSINPSEISERIKYIEHVFKIYTIPYDRNDYIEFVSVPANSIDLCMIIGHNWQVSKYLFKKIPIEKNIILVTCYCGAVKKIKLPNKNLYISKNINGYSDVYNGHEWNINFELTDSELTLYNDKNDDLSLKLLNSFERIV